MLTKRKKLLITGCLFGILLCVLGGIGTKVMLENWTAKYSCFNHRSSLGGFTATIDVSQQKQLIEQLQKFADNYGFKFQMSVYTPNGENFLVYLTRRDAEVIASNTEFDLNKFYVGFYNYDCVHPTVASDVEGLVSNLKN